MKAYRKKQPALNQSLFSGGLPLRRALNLAILAALYPAFSYANPEGAQIVSGQVSIDTATPGVTTITNSPNAIINWQNFSIAQNELTQFIQQNGQSAVLNRIIGQNPSEILGQLTSNGKVFLINPNGIVFGAGSMIDTQGLVASSLNLSDQDFLSGNYHFMAGSSAGNILNEGIIRAGKDGNIILIAPQIQNNGIIKSDGGSITLAAGQELTITNLDDPDIRFQIQAPADSVLNLGKLLTEGGAINVFASTIKHSGEINADSVQVDSQGNIQLVAQQDITLAKDSKISANNSQGDAGTIHIDSKTGTTLAQGTIEAQATQTGKGGNIELLGERVGVLNQAQVDASGANGGGQVLIGGDYQGKNSDVHNAKMTYVGQNTTIKADAKTQGNGGKVIAWADNTTRAYGSISAKGGALSGNGGLIETSGHQYLDVEGIRVNASAANGVAGTWLLDPNNIQIIHATSSGSDANIPGATPFAPPSDLANSTISDYTINQALSGYANVTLTTANTGTAGVGNILFDGSNGAIVLSKNSADAFSTTLTFNAFNDIKFLSSSNTTFETYGTGSTGSLTTVFNPGTGKVIVENGATLNLNGQGTGFEAQLANGKIWENNGTINMSGQSVIRPYLTSASTFNNLAGGILNIGTTGSWSFLSTSAAQEGIVNNSGTINVNSNTSWEAKFSQLAGGILNLHDGLSMQHLDVATGTINIDSGKTLWIPENHVGLNKFDGTIINGPGRIQIGNAVSSYSPTVTFNNVSTSGLTVLREQQGTLVFSGTNTFADTKFFANGTTNIDWSVPTAIYTGNTEWWAKGSITLHNDLSSSGNLTLGAGWNANIAAPVSTSAGMITNNADISANNVFFKAGKMALSGGTINGISSVNLLSVNAIDVGTIVTDLSSSLELSPFELSTITAPVLRIGDISSGAIDIKSPLALLNFNTKLSLTSGGAITQQAGAYISVSALKASGASVTLTEANPVGVISGSTTAGDFRYRSSNLLTVSTVDGTSGISVPVARNIALESDVGINQQAGANLNGGGLALKTPGWVDLLNGGNNISTVAADLYMGGLGTDGFSFFGGSNLTVGGVLSADGSTWLHGITTNNQYVDVASFALSINQPINAGTGTVDLSADTLTWDATGLSSTGRVIGSDIGILPLTPGRPIAVGGSCVGGTGSCLNINELWKISAPIIGIGFDDQYLGSHVAGDIFIGGITSGGTSITDRNAITTQIGLYSNGGITQSAAGIDVRDLYIEANGDVILNAANTITNLAAITLGQNFNFNNAQEINIDELTCSAASGCGNISVTASSGALNIPGQIDVGSGSLYLKATSGSVYGTGTSPDIIAGNVYVSAYNNIFGSGGLHINAPLISQLSATTGFIDIESFSGGATLGTVSAYDDIEIRTSSPLTVNGGITSTIGEIYLSATTLNINSLINASSAEVELEADKLVWDAAGYGKVVGTLVNIQPYTDNLPITVGAACIGGPGTCLSVTEMWRILSPTIGIGSDFTGDIFVSGITSGVSTLTDRNAATTRIGLISNGGITQSTTAINVQDLGIEANGEVILNAANKISNLAATTWGYNLTFNNGQGFNIVQMSGGTTSNNYYNFEYNIVGIDTCSSYNCGDLTLTSSGSIMASSAPITAGNFTLKSGGDVHLADLALNSGALNISAEGNIYSRSEGVSQMSYLNTANGWIDVENIGGFILGSTALSPGQTVVNAAGNIMIKAMSPLTVNGAVASSGGSVGLTADNGDTLSINAPVSAPNGIKLTGGTLSGDYAGSYMQYFNGGTGTSTDSTTEALSNTVTDSTEQVIAGVLGTTTPQSGQLLTDEPTESNSSTGESTDSSGKGKNSKQCTK